MPVDPAASYRVTVNSFLADVHPGVLLGVCAGGCTATPALAAVQRNGQECHSVDSVRSEYAVGNVLLAIWGTVIVALLK